MNIGDKVGVNLESGYERTLFADFIHGPNVIVDVIEFIDTGIGFVRLEVNDYLVKNQDGQLQYFCENELYPMR